MNQEETMQELCEIEGIKFYDTPEMGIACRVSEINLAISGKSNRGGFSRKVLGYKHIKEAFSNTEEREKQMQFLEYAEMGSEIIYLFRTNFSAFKRRCSLQIQRRMGQSPPGNQEKSYPNYFKVDA